MRRAALSLVVVVVLGVFASAQAPADLPLNKLVPGTLGEGGTAYRFVAKEAGVLTVLLVGTGGDLTLELLDDEGQRLPDGFSDSDIGGNSAREQLMVALPSAGTYLVRVASRGDGGRQFEIGAAFIQAPAVAQPPDPDGRPKQARPLAVGKPVDDSVDSSKGDSRDWYVVTASEAGTVTVVTRGDEGDLVLEAFSADDFSKPLNRSDQDLTGKGTNESIVVEVKAGQRIYLRVTPAFSGRSATAYRISAGFMR